MAVLSALVALALLLVADAQDLAEPRFACQGFFTVLSTEWNRNESCRSLFPRSETFLRVISAQMKEYGTQLVVFATRRPEEREHRDCQLELPHVTVMDFNASVLLSRHGFSELEIVKMKTWVDVDAFQRRSDVFRLALAAETGMSYLDSDVLLLAPKPDIFLQEYTALAVWHERSGAALEISNSAFCLSPSRLTQRFLPIARALIAHKGANERYTYTELGSQLFQRAVVNDGAVRVLSQNHPASFDQTDILGHYLRYEHQQLHLTGAIRNFAAAFKGLRYEEYVQSIRETLGLPPLQLP